MEQENQDVPLPPPHLRVGIIYNLKNNNRQKSDDEEAEYDGIGTVFALRDALTKYGCAIELLEADAEFPVKLKNTEIDIAFNIAEGRSGRGREAEVPALLNLYGIPFTGSDETTMCLSLDKALTKRLLRSYHIKTPDYAIASPGAPLPSVTKFPAIIKPNAEGSSKGIREKCVVSNSAQLREVLECDLKTYQEDMLIEQYIGGREFTVGVLGNGQSAHVFEPMEICFLHPTHEQFSVYSFDVKCDYKKHIEYHCPANLTDSERKNIIDTTKKVFNILGCRDFARIDYRMAEDGTLYFIEANPLPGLAPGYSDYPMLAGFCGMEYDKLVISVLNAALERLGLAAIKGDI